MYPADNLNEVPAPVIEAKVCGVTMKLFVDSGSQCTIIKQSVADMLMSAGNLSLKRTHVKLSAVNKDAIETLGALTLTFELGKRRYKHDVVVSSAVSFPGSVLIGTDFLQRLGTVGFDFCSRIVEINHEIYKFCDDIKETNTYAVTKDARQCSSVSVLLTETIELQPESFAIQKINVPFPDGCTALVEARENNESLCFLSTIAPVKENEVCVGILNMSDKVSSLKPDDIKLTVCLISDTSDALVDDWEEPEVAQPDLSHLNDEQQREILTIINENNEAISQSETDLGFCDLIEHSIDTGEHKSVATRQWPIPNSVKEIIRDQCKKMIKMGVIQKCSSPWRSPTLLVKKKDNSYRYCIDFRQVNNITEKDKFPLPRIDTVLESLRGAKYFSSLDLKSGYYQIPIKKEDRIKTAFATDNETYCYNKMAMGLCNAASTFQRVMQSFLSPVLGRIAFVFLDDIIIFSETFEEHVNHLSEVFNLIKASGMKVSPKKCTYAKASIKYLGHVVSKEGISVDPDKVASIREMREPKTKRDVRSVIGMASYYRKFVPNFSKIAVPLTELTKKSSSFKCNAEYKEAFERLKLYYVPLQFYLIVITRKLFDCIRMPVTKR